MNLKSEDQKGFTLIELLLYTSLTAMIILVVSMFFQLVITSRVKNQTIAEVEQQGTQIIQIVNQSLRNSVAINSPATGANAASLSINTTISANNPTIFDIASGVFQMKEGAAAGVPLTNNRVTVSALTYQNLSRSLTPGTIKYQFTITYNNPNNRNEYQFSKTFYATATLR